MARNLRLRIFLTLLILLLTGAVGALLVGQARESARAEKIADTLAGKTSAADTGFVDFSRLQQLPPPVARYFRFALTDGQPMIRGARFRQAGALRTSTGGDTWLSFVAEHRINPPARGFLWNARIALPVGMHLRVLDSYMDGAGSGRVSFMSAFPAAAESGIPELDAGALHRYLAEAAWVPTALLPQSGVIWEAVDERTALATLADHDTTVSLEFRFGDDGGITGVYTPARFGLFDGAYREEAWEGRYRDYIELAGMRIPREGEVGWYENGELRIVWEGTIVNAHYDYAR